MLVPLSHSFLAPLTWGRRRRHSSIIVSWFAPTSFLLLVFNFSFPGFDPMIRAAKMLQWTSHLRNQSYSKWYQLTRTENSRYAFRKYILIICFTFKYVKGVWQLLKCFMYFKSAKFLSCIIPTPSLPQQQLYIYNVLSFVPFSNLWQCC